MKQSTTLRTRQLVTLLLPTFSILAFGATAGAKRLPQSASEIQAASPLVHAPRQQRQNTMATLNRRNYNLARPQDWEAFRQSVQALLEQAKEDKKDKKAEKKERKSEKKDKNETQTGADNPQAVETQAEQDRSESQEEDKPNSTEKKSQTHDKGRDWSSKKVRAGLDALDRIAKQVQDGKENKTKGIHEIQEISWAIESNFVTPYTWRSSIDLGDFLFRARHLLLNSVGRGSERDPAANLPAYDVKDLSRVDPLPSPFWTPPGNIAAKDLYASFGRPALPNFADTICEYDSPHKGYGIHPSFEVTQNGRHWKVKFGDERSSEPFACRIFWALGFPVDIVDYTPLVKARYDRRILTDFNSRKLNATQIKLAGIPLLTQHRNIYSDPFAYIRYAMLKDGSRLETAALRERLFPVEAGRSRPKHPELKTNLYDAGFEKQIDYLVMQAGSFGSKETEDSQEVGYWDYNYLEHPKRREVRGMGVLDAWLENYDIRWGNNQLRLAGDPKDARLEFVVSDLGGIFGQSSGIIRGWRGGFAVGLYGNAPNEYGWTCTHSQTEGKMTVPIQDYMPATKTNPFYEMNLDDARWMARLIAQLTEPQLKAALIGAGYDAPVARLLLEKLVARRDRMMVDFGLSGEIAPLRPNGVNKRLSYDANADGPFTTTLADGRAIAAHDNGEFLLINGLLKPNPQFEAK